MISLTSRWIKQYVIEKASGREATSLWVDFTARQKRRLNSGRDWTAKMLSIDAVRVCVDKFGLPKIRTD